jgi:hypothetical protein
MSRCFTTVESANPNRPCIFPFEWKGIVYNTCTLTETPKGEVISDVIFNLLKSSNILNKIIKSIH